MVSIGVHPNTENTKKGPECAPLAARTSNQSLLKEINPEYSLEGLMLLMLKLRLQYFGHLIEKAKVAAL